MKICSVQLAKENQLEDNGQLLFIQSALTEGKETIKEEEKIIEIQIKMY